MFLKGKMRKSGGTNVPPLLLVEYNALRAALVKGRRSVSSKGRIKESLLFLSSLLETLRRNREEKKQRAQKQKRSLRSGLIEKRI